MLILVRFADLTLKGKNKNIFVRQVNKHIKAVTKGLVSNYDFRHDLTYLTIKEEDFLNVKSALYKIPGIHSFSHIHKTTQELDDIIKVSSELLKKELSDKHYTFKIESKRSDKRFGYTSIELTQKLAPKILNAANINVTIDVRNPEKTLHINVRNDGTYIYLNTYYGLKGFPIPSAGKGLLMLSGGIDSPVAGFLTMKQGVDIELFHFESTPLTPLESVQKAIDLTKKLAVFHPDQKLKLHLVPFTKLHEEILNKTYESYHITIMRRMMYKIAEMYALNNNIDIIINGEAIGQVASQTLRSMKVIESVTNIPIIRPLVTYDKEDIINLAIKLDTYDISIRPFNDCCSIYVPKSPVINPKIKRSIVEESKINSDELINELLNNIVTIEVDTNLDFEINMYGFDVKDAYNEFLKEKNNENN